VHADHRELQLRLAGLSPNRFEGFVYGLVKRQQPDARRLRPPDGGADIFCPASRHAFQVKRHTAGILWRDCEQSIRRCVAVHNPQHITSVLPVDLDADDSMRFDTRVAVLGRQRTVDFWSLSDIRRHLLNAPEVVDEFRLAPNSSKPRHSHPRGPLCRSDETIDEIDALLRSGRVPPAVALFGLSGMGKTQLAIAYANGSSGYAGTWWLNGSSETLLTVSLAKLSGRTRRSRVVSLAH
jgi:hypothetical protein